MVGLARTVPGRRRRLPEANVWQVWLTPDVPGNLQPHDDWRNPISGAVSRRGTADALRRRPVHAPVAGNDRKARARQQRDVNPDAQRRLACRDLARGRLGAKRGLQFSDRGLEARDVRAAAGDGDRPAAPAQGRPDSARMERAALAAPHHLHAGVVAGRHHHHVLAAGAARTGRGSACSAGPPKRACWRRCRRTSKPRLEFRIRNCGIA